LCTIFRNKEKRIFPEKFGYSPTPPQPLLKIRDFREGRRETLVRYSNEERRRNEYRFLPHFHREPMKWEMEKGDRRSHSLRSWDRWSHGIAPSPDMKLLKYGGFGFSQGSMKTIDPRCPFFEHCFGKNNEEQIV